MKVAMTHAAIEPLASSLVPPARRHGPSRRPNRAVAWVLATAVSLVVGAALAAVLAGSEGSSGGIYRFLPLAVVILSCVNVAGAALALHRLRADLHRAQDDR